MCVEPIGMVANEASGTGGTEQNPGALISSGASKRRSDGDAVDRGRRSTSPFACNAFRARTGNKRLTAYSTAMESIEAKTEPVEIEPTDSERATLYALFLAFFSTSSLRLICSVAA